MNEIVLAGNPNVGKSVFFNHLTGVYAEVSNFPGTTVDIKRGRLDADEVVDTPGIYGVSCFNDEERVARQVIVDGGIIINVVDALHLQRDLFLTQQLIDMGKRVLVCLNMMDEAESNGVSLDVDKLSALLGVPVIPTAAKLGRNMQLVQRKIPLAAVGHPTGGLDAILQHAALPGSRAEQVLLLEDDVPTLQKYHRTPSLQRDRIYLLRRQHVDSIVAQAVHDAAGDKSMSARIGRALLHPVTGIPVLLVTLALVFAFLGIVVAQTVVAFTEGTVMDGLYKPFVRRVLSHIINETSVLGDYLLGDFGLLTMVPTYLFGLLLPLVAGFYLVLSILEDSGYLPRIATLLDRLLCKIGLNGRAIIPFILGFGCVTVATVSTRLLGSRRERIIATALLGLTIPCSAQFGIIAGNVAKLGAGYTAAYFAVILLVFAVAGRLLDRFLPGKSSDLLIDLPRMRLPQAGNVLKKTYLKTRQFLREALPVFALGAAAITTLNVTHLLDRLAAAAAPVVEGVLRLPRETATAFIMGLIRRDFGAAGLDAIPMTSPQLFVAMVTLTLFVPCLASVLMMFKERGKLEAALIWAASFVAAILVGGVLAGALTWMGVQ